MGLYLVSPILDHCRLQSLVFIKYPNQLNRTK